VQTRSRSRPRGDPHAGAAERSAPGAGGHARFGRLGRLNVLPTAVIDRIEVLKDGASSIYGSDAIAGVINVITKKNVEGIQLEAQYSYPRTAAGRTYAWPRPTATSAQELLHRIARGLQPPGTDLG